MTTPTPHNFRALCAELLKGLDENRHPEVRYPGHLRIVMAEARAALEAQPEPVGPTVMEIIALRDEFAAVSDVYSTATGGQVKPGLFRVVINTVALDYARAVLARWGRPTIEPIPVSERLPGQEDCGPGGICWLWDPVRRVWHLTHFTYLNPGDFWLPYHALLIPRSEEI